MVSVIVHIEWLSQVENLSNEMKSGNHSWANFQRDPANICMFDVINENAITIISIFNVPLKLLPRRKQSCECSQSLEASSIFHSWVWIVPSLPLRKYQPPLVCPNQRYNRNRCHHLDHRRISQCHPI